MIIGASFDSIDEQKAFAEAESFPYLLISDADKTIGHAYEAAKGPDEQYPGVPRRISYLIDPMGTIAASYDLAGTDLSEHASVVLSDIASRS